MYKVYGDYLMHCSDDTLAHHGILGMKWGVRRYQNEDGTLTDAGRKRYARRTVDTRWMRKDIDELRNNKNYAHKFKELEDLKQKRMGASWKVIGEMTRFYKSKEYQKLFDKIAKQLSKEHGISFEEVKKMYYNEDIYDNKGRMPWDYYMNSNLPGADRARKLVANEQKIDRKIYDAADELASDILGKYGNISTGKYGETSSSILRTRLKND